DFRLRVLAGRLGRVPAGRRGTRPAAGHGAHGGRGRRRRDGAVVPGVDRRRLGRRAGGGRLGHAGPGPVPRGAAVLLGRAASAAMTAPGERRPSGAPGAEYRLIRIDDESSPDLLELSPVIAEAVAESVGAGQAPPTAVIRRQRPYALLGPKDRRLPSLSRGVKVLRDAGLPVYERIAGGTAVILDEGCLSFAVARPCRDFTAIHQNFNLLTVGVRLALARLGIDAEFGAAP